MIPYSESDRHSTKKSICIMRVKWHGSLRSPEIIGKKYFEFSHSHHIITTIEMQIFFQEMLF